MTILVPTGTSDHGDPNLLCTPIKWLDILIFFLGNYIAHAATVKALPGEKAIDVTFAVFLAISFPFSGVAGGLEAIVRCAVLYYPANDLRTAVRAGALCIVIRDENWQPGDPWGVDDSVGGRPGVQIKGIRTYGALSYYLRKRSPAKGAEVSFNIGVSEEKDKLEPVTFRKVHGLSSRIPSGYRLALLPSNADVIPNVTDSNTGEQENYPKALTISSSNNIPQSMVALVQVLYASYTLYKTRGDQLNRYGYAAFGLTVIPYIIMSFVNLLGNVLTPGYPTLYLVRSPELEEAQLRGAQIDGVVGKVNEEENSWYASNGYFTGQLHYRGEGIRPILRRKYANRKEQDTISGDMLYRLSNKDFRMGAEEGGILFPQYSRFKTIGPPYQGPRHSGFSSFLWWGFMAFFLGSIPYAVIGSLTRFQAAQSTQAQRVLSMFWLASGIFIGATIPFYGFSFQEIIDITRDAFSSEAKRKRQMVGWERQMVEREREIFQSLMRKYQKRDRERDREMERDMEEKIRKREEENEKEKERNREMREMEMEIEMEGERERGMEAEKKREIREIEIRKREMERLGR